MALADPNYAPLQGNQYLGNYVHGGWNPPSDWTQPPGYGVVGGGAQQTPRVLTSLGIGGAGAPAAASGGTVPVDIPPAHPGAGGFNLGDLFNRRRPDLPALAPGPLTHTGQPTVGHAYGPFGQGGAGASGSPFPWQNWTPGQGAGQFTIPPWLQNLIDGWRTAQNPLQVGQSPGEGQNPLLDYWRRLMGGQ